MGTTNKDLNKIDNKKNTEEPIINKKKCFAIMPIADHEDYETGHFSRVYNHLIKPACEKAGFSAIRADDAKASHMIMFDILKNIIECDMAICDLSSKNANVFYELGLRQAFNKKTILITDGRTNTPFDITGFRYVKYSHTLRIDSVESDIDEIKAMLTETDAAPEEDVNSIVKLLKIQPAEIKNIQLTQQDTIIFEMIKRLDEKMTRIENSQKRNMIPASTFVREWENLASKSNNIIENDDAILKLYKNTSPEGKNTIEDFIMKWATKKNDE